jgi:hypothetical protein
MVLVFSKILKSNRQKAAPVALDYIGKKSGQKGITNALKGSVDGLVDVGADKFMGGKMKKVVPRWLLIWHV